MLIYVHTSKCDIVTMQPIGRRSQIWPLSSVIFLVVTIILQVPQLCSRERCFGNFSVILTDVLWLHMFHSPQPVKRNDHSSHVLSFTPQLPQIDRDYRQICGKHWDHQVRSLLNQVGLHCAARTFLTMRV